jgi:MATE family multidrug resistance protein
VEAPALSLPSWKEELRRLMHIALPNVASMLSQSLLSIVDYAIVSALPNAAQAQAAVSSAAMVFFSCFSFLLGIMVCTTTMVSQSLGAKRYQDCSAYAWQGIWISGLFGIAGFALWPVIPAIYRAIGHEPAVQAMEITYTRIRLLSVGVGGATIALGHFFNGIHQPKKNTVTVVGANLVNGFTTYGLVLGAWGLPMLGVAGAALGSVFATAIRMLWLLGLMCFHRQTSEFEALKTWRPDAEKIKRLLKVGWPAGIHFVIEITAWAIFLVLIIGHLGTIHLAATATCYRFTELSFMPAIGIAMAVSTLVGRAIGENRHYLARRRAVVGMLVNMCYMGVMGLTYLVLGRELMDIFSDNPEVIRVGERLLIFVAIFQLFDAVGITYNNALRGAGDTRWPMIVGSSQAWLIMIGGGWLFISYWPELGSMGPWACATVFVITFSLTVLLRWKHGKWETLDVIGAREKPSFPLEIPLVEAEPDETTQEDGEGFGSRLRSP